MKNKIGFWGYPPPDVIQRIKNEYPKAQWFDLDFDFSDKVPDANILPESYCKIIKQIINNSLYFKNELIKIVAPVGKDKCDSGWFAAQLLKDMGFDVEETKFETFEHRSPVVISTSNMPLYDKITTITANIVADSINNSNIVQCKPKFGFWGVPPNDLEVLRLFPNETHVYGWTRCIEAKVPADIELEMYVEPDVPTVFYAQAFCSKTQLAKYLANKYNGLYIDIDDYASNSVKAKIEAFLRLR
ncbi:hypothetical protein J6I39_05805 [bacterium]|nr:hypothetical protein [bacterium]